MGERLRKQRTLRGNSRQGVRWDHIEVSRWAMLPPVLQRLRCSTLTLQRGPLNVRAPRDSRDLELFALKRVLHGEARACTGACLGGLQPPSSNHARPPSLQGKKMVWLRGPVRSRRISAPPAGTEWGVVGRGRGRGNSVADWQGLGGSWRSDLRVLHSPLSPGAGSQPLGTREGSVNYSQGKGLFLNQERPAFEIQV